MPLFSPKPPVVTEPPVISEAPDITGDMKFPPEIPCRGPCRSPAGDPRPGEPPFEHCAYHITRHFCLLSTNKQGRAKNGNISGEHIIGGLHCRLHPPSIQSSTESPLSQFNHLHRCNPYKNTSHRRLVQVFFVWSVGPGQAGRQVWRGVIGLLFCHVLLVQRYWRAYN